MKLKNMSNCTFLKYVVTNIELLIGGRIPT